MYEKVDKYWKSVKEPEDIGLDETELEELWSALQERLDVVHRGNSARSDHGNPNRLRQFYRGLDIDPLHHAVAGYVGIHNGLDTIMFEALRHIDDIMLG